MLKQHARFLQSLLFIFDLAVICASWVAAYYLRFLEGLARSVRPHRGDGVIRGA
jgi:hypothetical protein